MALQLLHLILGRLVGWVVLFGRAVCSGFTAAILPVAALWFQFVGERV